jgi:alkylation response protein AidB-like acyl-CoA dehydrogenase
LDVAYKAAAIGSERLAASELVARARALVPGIRSRAEAAEKAMAVPAETVGELRAAGVFDLMKPRRHGGHEYDFEPMTEISYEIGRACASTAWCVGLYIVHNWMLALFPERCQAEIWDGDPGAVIAGSYPPAGTCAAVEGGWRLSGSFRFASGCDNAAWMLCGTLIADHAGGPPKPGFLLLPRADCRIDHASWQTMGLSASGTKTLVIENAFVPRHRVLRFEEAAGGNPPGVTLNANPLYRIAFLALVPYSLAMPAVAAASAALDSFIDQIRARETRGAVRGANLKMAEFPQVQMRIAEASACIDAARLIVQRDCRETLAEVRANGLVSVASRLRNRRGHTTVTRLAMQAVDGIFYALGGHGLFLDNDVQRAWRDVHAIAHHVSLNSDAVYSMVGQHMLGLAPQGQF